jgi:hypothetical protein
MITFLNILISSSVIPNSDLILSHNSSRDVPISTSSVPKSHIVMSHKSSCYDPNINFSCHQKTHCYVPLFISKRLKINFSCPKNHLVQSQNLSCYDHKSTSPVPNSDLVLSHISFCYDVIPTSPVPKVTSCCPIVCLVMTQYQLLLSQNVTLFVP